MLENLIYAVQGIWSHKMRSFLTMLGVIIGIAAIIAIVSTIKGTNDQIMQNLIGAGNNAVTISLMQGESEYYMDGGAPAGVSTVSDEQKEEIRSLPDAADASFYVKRSYLDGVESGENTLDMGSICGVDLHYLSTCGYIVSAGRPFVEKDYTDFRKVILIDEKIAQSLFDNTNPLGLTIAIHGEPFIVIGVIRKADNFQPVINSFSDYMTYHQEEYGTMLIPSAAWPIIFAYDEPENCVVRAKTTEGMSTVGKDAEKIMNQSVTSASDIKYKA